MKRILAILMSLLIIASLAVLPASAANSAQTKVTAKKGDEVIYSLNLTVPEKVVGCDLSIYYDSTQLKPVATADFTGSFDPEKRQAIINDDLYNEAICVFSILSGIDFRKERSIMSIKFEAKKDLTDAHISYYCRFLYPENRQQFKDYKFTCDVKVNGKNVIDSKAPELNVKDEQSQGYFVNSVTGDGKDANVNMAEVKTEGSNGGAMSENNNNNNNNKKPTANKETTANNKETTSKTDNKAEPATSVSNQGGVDAPDKVTSSPSQTDDSGSNIFTSPWLWVVIGVIVIGVAAGIVVILIKTK